mmetsp:Transcript_706/g.1107  ORF Transcript_706/g.1107 Transcript_706/m.1107 type:complete len:465 (-) Transcript_706:190-1584(-)
MMAESTLPQKRDGEEGLVSPKTKAQKKEEAILKAREWARKRKGGDAAVDNDNGDGVSSPTKKAAKSEVAEDVITNLPNIPAKKSRRSGGGSDDVSEAESIGSRTRSRRRSVGVAAPVAKAAAAAAPTTTEDDVKSPPPEKKRRGRPRKTPKKAVVEEQVVEEKPTEQTPVEEEKKEAAAPAEETQAAEEAKVEEEAVEEEANDAPKASFLPHFAVFLHSVIIQWSIAFAVIMTFCLDWWLFQFGSSEEVLSSQRASSSMLGMWLVTIAGYSIAFGTFSQVGWMLTTSSLAMLSFAVKMYDDDMSSASLPVYQVFGRGITIPDLLLCISFVACVFVMKQPPVEVVVPSEPAAADDVAAPSEEASSPEEVNAEESKEVMEAVMIAAKEATGPRSLIGQRVSVEDNGFPSFGTVADYDAETRLWTILFDDENQEQGLLNRVELGSAFKSYSKHLADSLKAMWKSGEI